MVECLTRKQRNINLYTFNKLSCWKRRKSTLYSTNNDRNNLNTNHPINNCQINPKLEVTLIKNPLASTNIWFH